MDYLSKTTIHGRATGDQSPAGPSAVSRSATSRQGHEERRWTRFLPVDVSRSIRSWDDSTHRGEAPRRSRDLVGRARRDREDARRPRPADRPPSPASRGPRTARASATVSTTRSRPVREVGLQRGRPDPFFARGRASAGKSDAGGAGRASPTPEKRAAGAGGLARVAPGPPAPRASRRDAGPVDGGAPLTRPVRRPAPLPPRWLGAHPPPRWPRSSATPFRAETRRW